MDNKKRQLVFSILEFLNDCQQDKTIKEEDTESLEVATQCLSEIFNVDLTNPDHQREFSIKPTKLSNIFDIFIRTQQKRKAEAAAAAPKKELTEEDIKQAEELKNKGNTAVSQKDFKAAIDFYTQAIKINPENAVYYSNRAAAYSQDNRHDMAVDDAQNALKINPQFARAYSRLGHAYFHLSKYTDAIVAFEKGLELDPSNKVMQQSLETSKQKAGDRGMAESSNTGASARSTDASSAGGMPDLSSLLGGASGAGGMPDLSSVLSNPAMMNMAAQMMQNPEMMRMAQQFMGGANGDQMPDINELANNPNIRNMMNQFMGANNNNNNNPSPGTS